MKTLILQNVFVDQLTDEQFVTIMEAMYYLIGITSLLRYTNPVILRVSMVNELQRKLCKHDNTKVIADCKVIGKGKIQCDINDSYADLIHEDVMIKSYLFREAVKLIRDGELCTIDINEYADKLWDEYTDEIVNDLDAFIESDENE